MKFFTKISPSGFVTMIKKVIIIPEILFQIISSISVAMSFLSWYNNRGCYYNQRICCNYRLQILCARTKGIYHYVNTPLSTVGKCGFQIILIIFNYCFFLMTIKGNLNLRERLSIRFFLNHSPQTNDNVYINKFYCMLNLEALSSHQNY